MQNMILIVEDSDTCAENLRIALESIRGVEIQVASTGREALSILASSAGDVAAIITDLQMPSMTGLDLLRKLKADPFLMRIPIVLISGDSDPGLPNRAISSGAHSFFTKPYSPLAVRRELEKLLA